MSRADEIEIKRRQYKTKPLEDQLPRTWFLRGIDTLWVDLVDGPRNPYKAIFSMVTSTWRHWNGHALAQWDDTDPKVRVEVVRAALEAKTLPLANEAAKFTFEVGGLSRSAFDQIARVRIGAVIASLGSGCDMSNWAFRISERVWQDEDLLAVKMTALKNAHAAYHFEVDRRGDKATDPTFESAREVLPMSTAWRFVISINYAALRGLCARRMCSEHQPDTVAVAWLLRARLLYADAYPLLGAYLRPACDAAGRCLFHKPGDDSEFFRGLNTSCGRNPLGAPCDYVEDYATHQSPNTDSKLLDALGVPKSHEQRPEHHELTARDRELFQF